MDHVYYNNEKFYVKDGVLSILRKGVKSLSEIEGLEKLTNLKVLNLGWNEIENLETLKKLRILHLMTNEISKIKGLNNLTNFHIKNLSNCSHNLCF